MPYLTPEDRERVLRAGRTNTVGELTYGIQQIVALFMRDRGLSYQTCAEVLGALEGVKADFVRRVLNPYEELKQRDNGDCWDEEDLPHGE